MPARVQELERNLEVWRLPTFMAELSTQGNDDLVVELIDTFVEDTRLRLKAIHDARERCDMREAREQAHTLKGSCRQMGADGMALTCQQIEALAQAGDAAGVGALLGVLEAHWPPVRTAMTACSGAFRNGRRDEQVVKTT